LGVALHFVFLRCAEDARGIAKIGALEPQEEGKHMVMRAHARDDGGQCWNLGPKVDQKQGRTLSWICCTCRTIWDPNASGDTFMLPEGSFSGC